MCENVKADKPDEIEVTEEMVRAGINAYWGEVSSLDGPLDIREKVAAFSAVFRAMYRSFKEPSLKPIVPEYEKQEIQMVESDRNQ